MYFIFSLVLDFIAGAISFLLILALIVWAIFGGVFWIALCSLIFGKEKGG